MPRRVLCSGHHLGDGEITERLFEDLGDDEGLFRHPGALVEDAEGISGVLQDRRQHRDVEAAEGVGEGVGIAVVDGDGRGHGRVGEPETVAQAFHYDHPLGLDGIHVETHDGHEVPGVVDGEFHGHDLSAGLFHVEGQEPTGWTDLEDPLPSEGHVAEVGIGIDGQVDDALDAPMAGEIEGVVEDAVLEPRDVGHVDLDRAIRRAMLRPRANSGGTFFQRSEMASMAW
jgi:hypothetical protein